MTTEEVPKRKEREPPQHRLKISEPFLLAVPPKSVILMRKGDLRPMINQTHDATLSSKNARLRWLSRPELRPPQYG